MARVFLACAAAQSLSAEPLAAKAPLLPALPVPTFQRGGYLENWQSYEDIPGPFNVIYYGFLSLAHRPNAAKPPDQRWSGEAIYETVAQTNVMDVMLEYPSNPYEWQRVKIQRLIDNCRAQGKLFMWSIGGWSDLTRTISDEQIPLFVYRCIELLRLGGDGIDLLWEHLSESKETDTELFAQQRNVVGKTISALRAGLEEAGMGDRHISYSSRWNCFWTSEAVGEYNAVPFKSDGECLSTFANLRSLDDLSWVNVIMYDVAPLSAFNDVPYFTIQEYGTVLAAAEEAGLPKGKIVLGFEPGFQFSGGIWEGFDIDFDAIEYMKFKGYGGAFFWTVNDPNSEQNGMTPPSSIHHWQGSLGANARYIAERSSER